MKWKLRLPKKKTEVALEAPQNEYYERISSKLGLLQVILYLSLLAFVVVSFFANTELITYRNFYYFFKDLNASAETVDVFSSDQVTYPSSGQQSFTLYRKGLAVAGNETVTVFTATGRQTVSYNIQYQNPTAVGTGKYLLVYEMGGQSYSLYNSYTQIFSGKSDYPIWGAAVSESGMYALISRSAQYPSVVTLYNSDFEMINRYNRNGFVMDVAINAKGTRLALLVSKGDVGALSTTLTLYKPHETESLGVAELGDSLALSCAFSSDGTVSVLCSDSIQFVGSRGEVLRSHSFDGKEILSARLGDDGAAVALKPTPVSQKSELLVFDSQGRSLYRQTLDQTVLELDRTENTVYLMSRTGITCLDAKTGRTVHHACQTARKSILAVSGDEVLLCSAQKADYIRFSLK